MNLTQGNTTRPLVKDLLDRKIAELEQGIQQSLFLKMELGTYRSNWVSQPLNDPDQQQICSLIEGVTVRATLQFQQ